MGMDCSAELHFGLQCDSFTESIEERYLYRSYSQQSEWSETRYLSVKIAGSYGSEVGLIDLNELQERVAKAKEKLKDIVETCISLAESDYEEDCANWLRSIDVERDCRLLLMNSWG